MPDTVIAVGAASLVAASAAGAGSLVCPAARDWPAGRRWLLRLLTGLGLLPLLQVILFEVTGFAAPALVATVIGVAGLAVAGFQERRWRGVRVTADRRFGFAVILAVGLMATALTGLLRQPGFDGLDPWRHAFGARYVADTGQLRQPDPSFPLVHYVDAYPPLFDVLLAQPVAILGVTSVAVKGVAALLVAVAPLALWLLALSVTGDGRLAAVTTILYAVLANAVPRHLWGHSLAIVLGLCGLAAANELRRNRSWLAVVATCFGAALLAAPSQGIKLGLLLVATTTVAAVVDRSWMMRLVAAGVGALAIAAVWLVPAAIRSGGTPMTLVRAMQPPELRRADTPLTALGPEQAVPVPWTPKPQDMIDLTDVVFFRPLPFLLERARGRHVNLVVVTGLGAPLLILVIASLAGLRRVQAAVAQPAVWFAIAAVLVGGAYLGVAFFPWRSWLIAAPAAALLGSFGLGRLSDATIGWRLAALAPAGVATVLAVTFDVHHGLLGRQLSEPAWLATVGVAAVWAFLESRTLRHRWTAVALIGCHLMVAAPIRAAALLDPLPPKVFYNRSEHQGYLELSASLPRGTRVWPVSGGLRFDILVALDLGCTPWADGELAMARRCSQGDLPDAATLATWLQDHDYQVVVIDPSVAELQNALGRGGATAELGVALDTTITLRPRSTPETEQSLSSDMRVWDVVAGGQPTAVIIDRNGIIRYFRQDVDYRHRPPASELLSALDRLTDSGSSPPSSN